MNISELIDRAKDATKSLGAVAEALGKSQSRISEWKKGIGKPSATDIMLMAEMADLPPLETLAEIESQLDAERASVWQRALGNLRAAGVAATVVLGATAVVSLTSKPADAAEKAQENKDL
ncbi:transcriptional regulator, partial [Burkholderia pseudomallei]|uniref:helix-turn-helix domain-containing protein n=1 Tax=Burkholderia pseudomallei TaxID=28450 RepID=UPI0009754ACB